MFNQYESNIKATIKFLRLLNVKVNSTTVHEALQNHPDWPSLLCISDSLKKWNVPNGASKIGIDKIEELPCPFIAYTNDKERPIAIITQVSDTKIQLYQKNYNKSSSENREDFLITWTGVYLIAEPNDQSGESDYEVIKRNTLLNSLIPYTTVATFLIISFALITKIAINAFSPISVYIQYLISLAGIGVTSLLVWHEIDKNNPLLQKVCTGIIKGDCNAILTGKQAQIFNWLSWSEVGLFYFTGSMITLLALDKSIYLLAWFNILALPYTIFSIYYQWRIAKQWCVLCLVVQALILLGAINISLNIFLIPIHRFSFLYILSCLVFFAMTPLFWFTLKPYILRLQQTKNTKREYLRIKFNTPIFNTLLKNQKLISLSTDGLGIDIGNPAAENTIIKVCNPYCSPCARAHVKIEELLKKNRNVSVKIVFTTPNDDSTQGLYPVRHLLAIASENNQEKTKQALDDWYFQEKKSYENFAVKQKMNGELEKQGDKIEAMYKWCKATNIYFTPTIFVNGYQLPDAYGIEDLEYFLQE